MIFFKSAGATVGFGRFFGGGLGLNIRRIIEDHF